MKKIIFIVGPTASGKTDLALSLATLLKGIIINADSRQVYKDLDIISGKDLPKDSIFISTKNKSVSKNYNFGYYQSDSAIIYLLDLVDPYYSFSVFDYLKVAIPLIKKLFDSQTLPIVVGGTGFYIKALLDGIETVEIPQNTSLRKKLGNLIIEELQNILKKENPQKFAKMNNSDLHNKRRLIRSIEISKFINSSNNEIKKIDKLENIDPFIIGLFAPKEIIKKRIQERVKKRIKQGAEKEAKKLYKNIDHLSEQVKTSGGYKELFEYLNHKISFSEALKSWETREIDIAKKQMTWFKKDKRIKWFDITENNFETNIYNLIKKWLKN